MSGYNELYGDYLSFAREPEASWRYIKLTKDEKWALYLSQRQNDLSEREKNILKRLLAKLDKAETLTRRQTLQLAKLIADEISTLQPMPSGDLLDKILADKRKEYLLKYGEMTECLDMDEVVFLAQSRINVLTADKDAKQLKRVAYLIPVYKEFNRLKKKKDEFTGENFLEVKTEQLSFLYERCRNLSWDLYYVDDEPPSAKRRTIDVIKEQLQGDSFDETRSHIHCLGYEHFTEQIACYEDKNLSHLSPDEFAEQSVKGGIVQCALRYLAGIRKDGEDIAKADVIVMSDADLSTNLGITGGVLSKTLTQESDMAIGSRRMSGSVVAGKSSERHLLSFGFNFLAHALLNVQVSDTQAGCKAITPEAVKKIHGRFHDLSMSFDVEIIRALQDIHCQVKSIPTYWRDSPYESQSAGQSKNMLIGLAGIFKHIYSNESTTPTTKAEIISLADFAEMAEWLAKEPEFPAVMSLAKSTKFNFLVEFSSEIYSILTPKTWRNFVNHFSLFLCELAHGQLNQQTVNLLFDDFQTLGFVNK